VSGSGLDGEKTSAVKFAGASNSSRERRAADGPTAVLAPPATAPLALAPQQRAIKKTLPKPSPVKRPDRGSTAVAKSNQENAPVAEQAGSFSFALSPSPQRVVENDDLNLSASSWRDLL